ncbi:MAG TPA: Gfo/Idh/MocA family oxidoreductase [Gemmatimonadaceae bacterium]|jgi:predicted dehydrogenase|nr:Gfo/Idh/MocA family oxidoreductase [Gemmatimonadaceae bacterium]
MSRDDRELDRREFLKTTSAMGVGAMAASHGLAPLLSHGGSPNEKVVVAVIGVNGRGVVHAQNFSTLENSEVAYVCDVDANVVSKAVNAATKGQKRAPKVIGDFRRVLDDKSVDAISIATPDHWHAPMTLLALKAGKHVYLEKPSGHDPHEDELLIHASSKYKTHVQLGTQRRSGPRFFEAVDAIKSGAIGKPYLARTWYANTRTGIGKGKNVPVPSNLDYALWQGPAPRTPYRDNIIHYNWHWFTRWGTGEICNNGTHELDVARWLLGVDYPTTVDSVGTRKHFDDDWEFPDAQDATFEFEGGKTIVWHGQSCNGLPMYGRPRGTTILGTNGSMIIDQDGYVITDLKGKTVKDTAPTQAGDPLNTVGDDSLTLLHMKNFVDAIRTGAKLNAPISDGAKTGLLCHLGTISHQTGRKLKIDPKSGRIVGDPEAMKRWQRTYEAGWEPTVG